MVSLLYTSKYQDPETWLRFALEGVISRAPLTASFTGLAGLSHFVVLFVSAEMMMLSIDEGRRAFEGI